MPSTLGTETHDPNVSTPTGDNNSSDHQVDNEIVLNNKSPTNLVSASSELPLKDVGKISSTPGPSTYETLDLHATEHRFYSRFKLLLETPMFLQVNCNGSLNGFWTKP
jgi:hypothetical protein